MSWALVVMPVVLATQEAENRRMMAQNQPGQAVCETQSWKYSTQKKLVELFKQ
jgi:hypothetical protein